MKFKIYYTIDSYEDNYTLEADTIEDIVFMNRVEIASRGLHPGKNHMWSEGLKN